MRFRSWAATHPGAVRTHNEDSFVDRPDIGLWAVADGAGGHEAGEVASSMIAETLSAIPAGLSASELLAQVRLRVAATHQALRDEAARRGPRAMVASTLAVLLARDGHFACLWAGDSRVYLLRAGRMMQVTRDHSLVQDLVDSGAISAEDADGHPRANIITRAVGADCDTLELEKISNHLQAGDRFLLCSDGLSKTMDDRVIAGILSDVGDESPAELLLAAALDLRATDNVTAVAVQAEA
ncbi:MAG TPA: protein phosphatase 2C domain-containing protein [Acetobacteraceae bacterium]